MDSHITGPFKAGYGALPTLRGKRINFDTAAGDYELGVVQASEENPVFVEIGLVDEETFDATPGASPAFNLAVIAIKESNPATTIPFTYAAKVAAYTTNSPVPANFVAYENWRIIVRFDGGTDGTAGRATGYVRASGLGQLPVNL